MQTMITQHCYHHKRETETSCASRRKNVTPLKVLQATGPFTAKTKNTTLFSLECNQQSLDYGKIRGTNILVCSSNKLQDKRREMGLLWWQWIRIRLPMQGTCVWSLVREDFTYGAAKSVRHNYWACTPEPTGCNY